MSIKKAYILSLMLFTAISISAQNVELTTTVSKNKLGVNQRLKIEFTINKQGADDFVVRRQTGSRDALRHHMGVT